MTRGGKIKSDASTERKCLVLKDSTTKTGLVRFVTDPEGAVAPDVLGKLPGRGFYVTCEREILQQAIDKNLFAQGAKQKVKIPENLIDMIDGQIAQKVIDMISMARKAGGAVAGFEKVKSWLAGGQAKVLLQASDGSARGKDKLWTPEGGRFFGCLSAQELGLAFGRGHVVHCALSAGGLSKRVIEEATRLRGLREIPEKAPLKG